MRLGRTAASAGENGSWYGWFVAPSAGTYAFFSEGDADTYATLYEADGETWLDENDDGDDRNFRIDRELAKDEAVVLEVRQYGYESFECDVVVEAGAASMLASRLANGSPVSVLGDGAEAADDAASLPLVLEGSDSPEPSDGTMGIEADGAISLTEALEGEAAPSDVTVLESAAEPEVSGEVIEIVGGE